jgi:hypothetical protein
MASSRQGHHSFSRASRIDSLNQIEHHGDSISNVRRPGVMNREGGHVDTPGLTKPSCQEAGMKPASEDIRRLPYNCLD